eukprot:TRINITY_DN20182_c0_g1_i1.p2 TRINITY_DN20182_c0_g1~~TRINITY_DN20182_c0_g1_i1.p2  ORF type:complete len:116 (+),score=0.87 TRINITY_DN20182_c0_g1_i1:155-502(+)
MLTVYIYSAPLCFRWRESAVGARERSGRNGGSGGNGGKARTDACRYTRKWKIHGFRTDMCKVSYCRISTVESAKKETMQDLRKGKDTREERDVEFCVGTQVMLAYIYKLACMNSE